MDFCPSLLSFYLLLFDLPPYSFLIQVKSPYFLFIFLLLGSSASTSYLPHFTGSGPLYHAFLSSDITFSVVICFDFSGEQLSEWRL
jgi:hypothetical protein